MTLQDEDAIGPTLPAWAENLLLIAIVAGLVWWLA